MSIPEHTIRIISHKSQRHVRKELIQRILGRAGTQLDYSNKTRISTTQFSYDTAVVNIIDCDYDMIEGKIGKTDIIFADFRYFGNYYHTKPQYDAMIKWLEKFKKRGKNVWYFYEKNTINDLGYATGIKVDDTYNHEQFASQEHWIIWIDKTLSVRGIQTIEYLFKEAPFQPVSTSLAQSHAENVPEAPWPVPELTITVPKFVKVESMKHDPAAGTITIRFG